jgi:DNA gyrase subunit A
MRDESDRDGMRIVIELKRDGDHQVILNQLFAMTPMQSTFNVILLAISHGQPKQLNLKEALQEFVSHRKDVVTRRCLFELRKAQEREHILLGYKIAIDNLDAVIELIRSSRNPEEARNGLMTTFELSEIQAKAILDLRLERLTRMERDRILLELEEIRKTIGRLREILGSETVLMDVIAAELQEIREKYADKRRSEIIEDLGALNLEDLIPVEDMVVTVSAQGFIKRTQTAMYRSQRRGGKGKSGMQTRDEDWVVDMFVASTHTYVLFFTDKGRVFRVRIFDIPQGARTAKGRAMVNLLNLAGDERVAAILPVPEPDAPESLVFGTRKGVVKRTELVQFKNIRTSGLIAIRLDPDDDLIAVRRATADQNVLLFSRKGKSVRFGLSDVRPIGRDTRGVRGMALGSNDFVVGMEIVQPGCEILAVTERGYGKRTPAEEYRLQHRGGTGILAMRVSPKVGNVVAMREVKPDDELMLTSSKGTTIRIKIGDVSLIGRVTQGVRVMNMAADEKLVAVDVVVDKDDEQELVFEDDVTLPTEELE